MELVAVVFKPNVGLGVDTSRSIMKLDMVASRPNVGVDVYVSKSNMGWTRLRQAPSWGCARSRPDPTVGWGWRCPRLDLDVSTPNVRLSWT
jgi:hypothetical protein